MTIRPSLVENIAHPIAEHLCRIYLRPGFVATTAAGALAMLTNVFKASGQHRAAARRFHGYAELVIDRLVPLFEHEAQHSQLALDAVSLAIGTPFPPFPFLVGVSLTKPLSSLLVARSKSSGYSEYQHSPVFPAPTL